MILIVGGAFQGKAEYAKALADRMEQDEKREIQICLNVQEKIRQVMESGKDPEPFWIQVCDERPDLVTLDEVGSGIVPLDGKERKYREAVGHAGQYLAAHADMVYRMVCGTAVRIK